MLTGIDSGIPVVLRLVMVWMKRGRYTLNAGRADDKSCDIQKSKVREYSGIWLWRQHSHCRQLCLSLWKAHMWSLTLTHLDAFWWSRWDVFIQSLPCYKDTGLSTVYFHFVQSCANCTSTLCRNEIFLYCNASDLSQLHLKLTREHYFWVIQGFHLRLGIGQIDQLWGQCCPAGLTI